MKLRGAKYFLPFMPAAMLLAGIFVLLSFWPELHTLLPDDALRNPSLLTALQILLALPLVSGVVATAMMKRFMLWPWLWLGAILLLNSRAPLEYISQLTSLGAECCLLLFASIAEMLLICWRERIPHKVIQYVLAACACFMLLPGWQMAMVPDNLVWQRLLMLVLAAACLLAVVRDLGIRSLPAALALPQFQLPNFRLPSVRMPSRPAPPAEMQTSSASTRPMLSLDEGYLVRRESNQGLADRRRRTG